MKPTKALIVPSLAALLATASSAVAAPAIRTSDDNRVPTCASPQRLTAFLRDRNPNLDPKYRDIADWYRYWGDAWRVRWDYAFFQMIVETNALKFRKPDGDWGDVRPVQNNFAGLGATGGGVPGDRFPDIKTGVHAQIQHLVAYSGEHLAEPVAPRTALKQDDIIEVSRRLKRPVTFGDLARRWAADRHYARTIDYVARQFSDRYCQTRSAAAEPVGPLRPPAPKPVSRRDLPRILPPPYRLGGPKPQQNLAGPEILPWLVPKETEKPAPQPAAKPAPHPKPQHTAKPAASATAATSDEPAEPGLYDDPIPLSGKAPEADTVRTIWSRGDAPAKTPAQNAAHVAVPVQNDETVKQIPVSDNSESSGGFLPLLPHFRIAPKNPEPSRLGGPVPAEPVRPEKVTPETGSVVHFKEVITTPEAAASPPQDCTVLAASYGGQKTLLVRSEQDGAMVYTALTVLDGFEKSMFDTYVNASAPGAKLIGEYPDQKAALKDARTNCPAK